MKWSQLTGGLALACASACALAASTVTITGAGSSFVYPVMQSWTKLYAKATRQRAQVNYQAIGSGGGIRQLSQKTIDFAASDEPLSIQTLKQKNWVQFPVIVGGIVPVVNISGVTNNQLVLDGSALANIYMGNIQYWDDVAIKHLNPHVALPHNRIITVHRADGSGTTYNFSYYLSAVSHERKTGWLSRVGYNSAIQWPGKMKLGAKGNAGVAAQVQNIKNSIGYVEFAYAQSNNLVMTRLKNQAGYDVTAGARSFASAASHANWSADSGYATLLANQPGRYSWPIVATTYGLIARDSKQKADVRRFFTWSFANGTRAATKLQYVMLPAKVTRQALSQLAR